MRKRSFALLLAVVLFIGFTSASAMTMAGFDGKNSYHVWSDNAFFTRMEALTGLTFTFDEYTDAEKWQAAKNAMFQPGGELPDVLFKATLTPDEEIRYSDSGQLIDLLPLLPDNAPHLWALLQENPEWLAAITLPSGKIAALPTINPLPLQNAMWINQTWLDALHLDMPVTWDSLVEVLTAFLTRDPNGNGKQDEIPLSFLGPWELKFLSHAFGPVANDYNIYADDLGQVHFLPMEDNFIRFLEALVALREQDLLDKNGFTNSNALRTVSDENATLTYGMFFGPNPILLFPTTLGSQYSLLTPLIYDDHQTYRDLFGPIATGSFAITSACETPEQALAWVDILYSQDGAIQATAGNLGEDYIWNDDGTWQYTLDLETNSSYILYDLTIYDTGFMPWLFPTEFHTAYDVDTLRANTESLIELQKYVTSPFPYYYVLSLEQREYINTLQTALGAYVDESIARFVLGELDIYSQEDIDAFRSGLYERDLQEFITFWQEIYDQQRIR